MIKIDYFICQGSLSQSLTANTHEALFLYCGLTAACLLVSPLTLTGPLDIHRLTWCWHYSKRRV